MSFTPGSKVLITGASGYIAVYIVGILFSQGYEVVDTVRSAAKGDWLAERYPGFKYEIFEDLLDSERIVEIFKLHADVKYVLHTANPMRHDCEDNFQGIVEPAIQGAREILNAAYTYGKNIEKFVYTASMASLYSEMTSKHPGLTMDESTWSPIPYEMAAAGQLPAYVVSKKYAEKTIWDFKNTVQPNFSIETIVIPFVYGPPIHDTTYTNFNSTIRAFNSLISLPADATEFENMFPAYHDVRDAALVYVAALEKDSLNNGRWLVIAGMADDQVVLDILHHYHPEKAADLPKGVPGSFKREEHFKYDNSKTMKVLGFDFIPFEKTIVDEFDAIMNLKKKANANKA